MLSLLLIIFSSSFAQNVTLTNDSIVDQSKLVVLPDSLKTGDGENADFFELMRDSDLVPMDQPLSVQDSLKRDTLTQPDREVPSDSLRPLIRLDVVMPLPSEIDSIYEDSMHIDSLVSNSFHSDSLIMDALVVDSVLLDDMAVDSTYEVRRRVFLRDSLRLDSLRKDSLRMDSIRLKQIADRIAKKQLVSVLRLHRIMDNFRTDYEAALERWNDYYLTYDEVTMKPEYYKFVVPLTYYTSSIRKAGTIEGWEPEDILSKDRKKREERVRLTLPDLRTSRIIVDEVDKQLLNFYVNYPEEVKHNETEFADISLLADEDMVAGPREENILDKAQVVGVGGVSESDLVVYRPNFWTFGGNGYLQFSQNHISDNWYKGGESTKSLLSGLVLFANFNDKQRIQFENKLEWKLGFITAPSDTMHSYKANNDMFRLNSKFGLKAVSNWYYTLSVDFKTQLFSSYQTNTDNLISALLSPAELNVGLGMDYKYIKDGICNLSVLINPINYTLYSVLNDDVDPTKFNIKKGHKHENVFGSRFEATLKWKIFTPLVWESRLSYTTNYDKALAEWENSFTFVVNKYLSTKLFVNGRFDDGVKRKEGQSYFQLQEILSFGLNYTW